MKSEFLDKRFFTTYLSNMEDTRALNKQLYANSSYVTQTIYLSLIYLVLCST